MSIFTQVVSKLFDLLFVYFFTLLIACMTRIHSDLLQDSRSIRYSCSPSDIWIAIWVSIAIRLPILNLPGALNYKHNINKLMKDLFFSCNTPCISQDLCLYYYFRFVQLMSNYMYTCGSGIFCLKLSFSSSLSSVCLQWII